jgi:Ca2+-binding EF-hand superfamily protein
VGVLQEFVGMMVFFLRGSVEEKLRLTYKAYDLDGDGCLNDFEVEKIIMSGFMLNPSIDYTTEEVDDLVEECMNKLDVNGDGMIEYHEFRRQCLKDPLLSEVLGKVLVGVEEMGDHIEVL